MAFKHPSWRFRDCEGGYDEDAARDYLQSGGYAPGVFARDLDCAEADAVRDEDADLVRELDERDDSAADSWRGDFGLVGS